MYLKKTTIEGLVEIGCVPHWDDRGAVTEIFRDDWFRQDVSELSFVQENQSLSNEAGTIRGLHAQRGLAVQGKLVRCTSGSILDVAVDARPNSSSFGRWQSFKVSHGGLNQVWVPPGFLHGFCTLEDYTVVVYRLTAHYAPEEEIGVRWDDPDLGISWPIEPSGAKVSEKDRAQPLFRDCNWQEVWSGARQ